MATNNWQPNQATQSQAPAPAPAQGGVTLVMPTTVTLKDIVVIITALITIISSWTFYTMRLSVLEQKVTEGKTQIEKMQTDMDEVHKTNQEIKLKIQALEIRQSLVPAQSNRR